MELDDGWRRSLLLLTIQPIGLTVKERTTNGIRAYALWDAIEELDARERELIVKFVEGLKVVAACSWYCDKITGEYWLLLERQTDLKWAGSEGVAQEVCRAIEEVSGRKFVLQVGH